MDAIVLAGGEGRRLYPLTKSTPKAYLTIGGRRLYSYTLDMLREARGSLDRVILVLPRGSLHMLGEVPEWVTAVEQKGVGVEGALATGLEALDGGGEVVVSFIGYIARPPTLVRHLLDYYSTSEYPLAVSVAPITSGLETFGFVRIGPRGNVESIQETPGPQWMGGRGYVFAGALVGEYSFISRLAEDGFTAGLGRMASRGLVGALTWTGEWIELSYPWDLLSLPALVASGTMLTISGEAEVPRSVVLRGPIVIERGARIGESSVVVGPAYIGEGASVGESSIVGPNVSLERGASVGPLSVVRNTIAMEGARIGAQALVEAAILGPNSMIGHQAVVEPGRPRPRYPWVGDALERAPSLSIGAVLGPGARIGVRGLESGGFIE
ncbi:MAG: NDP-sugar synthase [Desulfurococcales archaeon]|nr:NDP-sugar synthase [Desulfurococcales archaeon]